MSTMEQMDCDNKRNSYSLHLADESSSAKDRSCGLGQRHFVAIMGLLGIFNIYTMRINLSMAIVAMVSTNTPVLPTSSSLNLLDNLNNTFHHNQTILNSTSSVVDLDVCPYPESLIADDPQKQNSSSSTHTGAEFDWDSGTQGQLLGSYFYGYIATQLLGGWLAKQYGGKMQFGVGILLCSVLALLSPVAAHVHYGLLMAIRIGQGLTTGFCYPALQQMLAHWSPAYERTKLSTWANAGAPIGNVVVFLASGFLAHNFGWESVFYVFGGIGAVWWVFWQFLIYDSPFKHPRISRHELSLISGSKEKIDPAQHSQAIRQRRVPWVQLVTSLPVWAMMLSHFGQNWGNYTLLTNLPTYMKNILHFNLSANGLFSALPYVALWLVSISSGYCADLLRENHYMSTTNVRKLFNTIGNLIPAVALVAVGYVGCDSLTVVVLLTLSTGMSGCTQCSYQVNSIDLSPIFASMIFGISNTLANVPGIISPYTVGLITSGEDGHTISNWRLIFYISGVIRLGTMLFYLIFASGETQAWNAESDEPVGHQ
ncbi:sialin-like isoform X2 [Paramacrobiotus metropolitanus]|nr:sialin-like isoform X2 [Paramacrobiotus metropolitanus]XP_055339453.1 sialin-like isoform X2 [Paramacrobiotus metropolitanus]XP_055339454.1 sialin-like isoform X2 [Paramacrobiotus metropolitanus]XP_055339455.1 sialin-like isoform X2 [Paramacrobiotus metropolitanus]